MLPVRLTLELSNYSNQSKKLEHSAVHPLLENFNQRNIFTKKWVQLFRDLSSIELGVSTQFDIEIHKREIWNIHKDFQDHNDFSCTIFLCQAVPKSPFYILLTYYPNYLLLYQPNFLSLSNSNKCISDLYYTTVTNSILGSNLNYKKLLKCVNTINFLCTNFNYKKAKNVSIPPPYLFPTKTTKAAKMC